MKSDLAASRSSTTMRSLSIRLIVMMVPPVLLSLPVGSAFSRAAVSVSAQRTRANSGRGPDKPLQVVDPALFEHQARAMTTDEICDRPTPPVIACGERVGGHR